MAKNYRIGGFGLIWDESETLVPPPEEQVEHCLNWLREHAKVTKTLRRQHSSYGLKHVVERYIERVTRTHVYISNGAMIEAARRFGLVLKPVRSGNPNCYFNVAPIRGRGVCCPEWRHHPDAECVRLG